MKKKNLVMISGSFVIMAFILGSYLYKDHLKDFISKQGKGNAEPFVRAHSQTLGSKNAKVTLVEFMDPACESCAFFHPYVKGFLTQNPGKIKIVIRYAPFHQGADLCVKILEAARNQGRYWQTLGLLFKNQRYWTHHHQVVPERVWELLNKTDLDMKRLRKDMEDPLITDIIHQDREDAATLNVKKTPTFFVNGKPLEKFGYNQLRALVLSEIEDNY